MAGMVGLKGSSRTFSARLLAIAPPLPVGCSRGPNVLNLPKLQLKAKKSADTEQPSNPIYDYLQGTFELRTSVPHIIVLLVVLMGHAEVDQIRQALAESGATTPPANS